MTITYTKFIVSIGCYAQIDGETDVVFKIQWTFVGTDSVFNSSIPCSTNVPYVAGQPFIPYSDLTEEQVLNWIEQYTTQEQMAIWENQIASNIATQKEIQYPPLPWQPTL